MSYTITDKEIARAQRIAYLRMQISMLLTQAIKNPELKDLTIEEAVVAISETSSEIIRKSWKNKKK